MRTLFHQTSTGLDGGIANYISSITKILSKNIGHDKIFVNICKKSQYKYSHLKYDANIVELPSTYTFLSIVNYIQKLVGVIRTNGCNIVVANALRSGFSVSIALLFLRFKFIYINHGLRYRQLKPGLSKLMSYFAENIVMLFAHKIVCVRNSDVKHISNCIYKKKICVIQTRLDLKKVQATKVINSNELNIVGIGSLIDVKRPYLFVDIIYELTKLGFKVKCNWYGDGPLYEEISKRIELYSVDITLNGNVCKDNVLTALALSDLVLMTSSYEVMPLSAIEAYSQSKPLVTTQYEGVHDILEPDVTGFIIPSSPKLAAIKIVNELSNLKTYGKNAYKKYIDNFSPLRLMVEEINLLLK